MSVSCQNINNLAPLIFRVEVLAAKKLNFQPWLWQLWNWFNAGEIFSALGKIRESVGDSVFPLSLAVSMQESKRRGYLSTSAAYGCNRPGELPSTSSYRLPMWCVTSKTELHWKLGSGRFLSSDLLSMCSSVPLGMNKHGFVCLLKHQTPEGLRDKDWDSFAVPFSLTLL